MNERPDGSLYLDAARDEAQAQAQGKAQAARAFEVVHAENVQGGSLDAGLSRSCGDCRLCCKLLAVQEIQKPRGEWCKHACSKGCGIYETRPQQCREFSCLWLLASHKDANKNLATIVPLDERPDKTKVVLTPFLGGVRHPHNRLMFRAVGLHEGPEGLSRAARVVSRLLSAGFAVLHNSSSRLLGVWFPTDGAYFKMPPDHPEAQLFDRTKASPEEIAHVAHVEAQARLEIAARESEDSGALG